MIIVGGSGRCECCGFDTKTRFLTKMDKTVCPKCMKAYDPPRMTLAAFNKSPYIWNFEADQYEKSTNIEQLEWCGWFTRSRQEITTGVLPLKVIIIYHMEFHEDGVKCLRRPDYPFFEEGIKECGVNECREFCNKRNPQKFKLLFPTRRSKFTL